MATIKAWMSLNFGLVPSPTIELAALERLGLGAKSQILSSVAPPRKKKLVTIFSQGYVWGPQTQGFLSFLWSIFCKWPVITVTTQTLKIAVHKIQD